MKRLRLTERAIPLPMRVRKTIVAPPAPRMLHETVKGKKDAVASAKHSHNVRIRSPRNAAKAPQGSPANPGAASRKCCAARPAEAYVDPEAAVL